MHDTTNGNRIHVATDGDSLPYIMVPLAQLDAVQSLLRDHDVEYWVEENAIALNDEPYIAVINLSKSADVAAVQTVLDKAG